MTQTDRDLLFVKNNIRRLMKGEGNLDSIMGDIKRIINNANNEAVNNDRNRNAFWDTVNDGLSIDGPRPVA